MSDETPEKNNRRRSPRAWENVIDRQIRQAIERGDFDGLPGKGKPLDLSFNPFVPEEMRQAFHILKNAGVAPEWIERDKEIRLERMLLEKMLLDQARWQAERSARSRSLAADQIIAEHEHLTRSRDRVTARFRERATTLNKLIDAFNLKTPNSRLYHERIQIEN